MTISYPALELFGIYDRGIANSERIALRVNSSLEVTNYALIIGFKGANDSILPAPDQFFWLGRANIGVPGWIFVYTGTGTPTFTLETHTKEPLQAIFWNKPDVVFTDPNITAALIRMEDVQVGLKNLGIDELRQRQLAEAKDSVLDDDMIEFIKRSALARLGSAATGEVSDDMSKEILRRLGENKTPKK